MKTILRSLCAVLLLSVFSSQSTILLAASVPKHLEVKGNSNSTGINAMPKRAATTCRTPYIRQSGPAAFCEGGSVTLSAPGSGTVVLDQLNSQGELHQYDKAGNYYYGSRQEVNSMYALDVFIWKESPNGERRAFAGALDLFPLSSTPGYTVANTGGLIVNFTIDNNGNLIVLNDGCKLKKITPAGVVTDLFPANSYCRSYYTNKGMTVDPTGNIYFTDYYGSGITKVDASTGIKSLFAGSSTEQGYADGAGTAARFSAIRDIVSDNAGNIYATDEYVVRKISPAGVVSTFYGTPDYFGNPDFHFGTDGDYGGAPGLVGLDGIDIDASGNIYLTAMSSVIKINPDSIGYGYGNGILGAGLFYPLDITINPSGNILALIDGSSFAFTRVSVWDTVDSYIWSTGATTRTINAMANGSYTVKTVHAGCTTEPSVATVVTVSIMPGTPTVSVGSTTFSCDNGPAVLTASAASGYLWNTGATTQSISVNAAGFYSVKAISGTCTSASSNVITVTGTTLGKPSISALANITNICPGGNTSLYQSYENPFNLYSFSRFAGVDLNTINYGPVDMTNLTTLFNVTSKIAADKKGNKYVSDMGYFVRRISADSVVTTLANFAFNDLAADNNGNVYVTQGNQVMKITHAGVTSVFAGSTAAGYVNAGGTAARFNSLQSIETDDAGNIYVWDQNNYCIRKITPAGLVSTHAGGPTAGYIDGTGTASRFNTIADMSMGQDGTLYLADNINNKIRKVAPDGTVSTLPIRFDFSLVQDSSLIGEISDFRSIAVNNDGYVYLTYQGMHFIKVAPDGNADSIEVRYYEAGNLENIGNMVFDNTGSLFYVFGSDGYVMKMTFNKKPSAYLWSNGSTGDYLTATAAGTYSLRTIAGSCTSEISNAITVTVTQPAAPNVTVSGATSFCSGSSVTLTSSATSNNKWSTGATTRSITVSAAGTYTVNTISGSCTSLTSTPVTVTITQPAAPTISASGTTSLCPAGSVTLTSSSATNNRWSTGATTQSISVSAAGSYTVYYTSGTCTSATSSATSVTLNSATSAAGSISGNTTTAQGNTESYSISSVAGATGYIWSYSGSDVTVTGSGTSASLEFGLAATSGTLSVYGTGPCGSGSAAELEITVNPAVITNLSVSSNQSIGGRHNNVVISGIPVVTLTSDLEIFGNMVVPDGATFVTGCHTVSGPGSFTLESGANIQICNTGGIAQSGSTGAVQTDTRSFSNDANYVFNGTASQVTGSGLPARVRNLTTDNAAGVTLSNATSVVNTLTVSAGSFNLDGKALTLLSSKTGTARLAEVPPGAGLSNASAFTAERWLDTAAVRNESAGFGAYYWLGAPVTGATVDAWNTVNNAYVPWTYDGLRNHSSIWLYDNSDNTFASNGGWTKPSAPTQELEPGSGARVWFNNSFFTNGATNALSGSPVTGNYNLPVTYCNGTCAGNTAANGWNLVANPYASTIDWNDADWTKTNIAEAVYVWRHKQNGYSSYVDGVGTMGGSNLIASGQGFMVKATDAGPVLTAKEGVKTASAVSA
ncbi:MAG: hypothetical protein V4543_01840, partial [Bacteroidota bacterium]